MDNTVYIALSKQTAAATQLEMIANNIANANTNGYKAEDIVFNQYLQKAGRNDLAYTKQAGTIRDNSQGSFETTNNPLDLAISGKGYFSVRTPQGERYTRDGAFTINQDGELVTGEGYQVLDQAGQAIQFQPEDRKVKVYADGRMEVDGQERATIGVYLVDANSITKEGSNLYSSPTPGVITEDSRIAQNMLEKSNVNTVMQMTKMLSLQRDYERTSKFINQAYDLQESAIRTLGRPN